MIAAADSHPLLEMGTIAMHTLGEGLWLEVGLGGRVNLHK